MKLKLDNKLILGISLGLIILFLLGVNFLPEGYYNNPKMAGEEKPGVRILKDYDELSRFFDRGNWLPQKKVPYKEVVAEYPQLAVLYLTIPFFFTTDFVSYGNIIYILNGIAFVGLIFLTLKLLEHFQQRKALIWLLFLPSMVYFTFNRFDIWQALIIQISLWFLIKNKFRTSVVLLALGFLFKWYSIFFLPLYLILLKNQLSPENYLKIKKDLIYLFILIIVLVMLLSLIWSGLDVFYPYLFQLNRGAAVGSLYSLLILILIYLKLPAIIHHIIYNSGLVFFTLLQALLFILVVYYFEKIRRYIKDHRELIYGMSLIMMLFVLFNKFYSNQWIIWFLPLLILFVRSKKEIILVILFDLINYLQFPIAWDALGQFSWSFHLVAALRTIILIWLILIVVKRVRASYPQKVLKSL